MVEIDDAELFIDFHTGRIGKNRAGKLDHG
jgi:hypothetical protein